VRLYHHEIYECYHRECYEIVGLVDYLDWRMMSLYGMLLNIQKSKNLVEIESEMLQKCVKIHWLSAIDEARTKSEQEMNFC
jgi:hypothetical protein